jgi:MinD superfamily P-loop ATPase
MIVAVASGKGGTGKTSVAVNLALSIGNIQLLDCDVEEPNAHLLLNPKMYKTEPVYVLVPHINEEICSHCGECAKFCQYNALFVCPDKTLFFPEICHSCGGCTLACPKQAITEENRRIGALKFGSIENLKLIYGELDVGEPMAVPLIKAVKNQIQSNTNVIIDAPVGTSCPVIETVRETDFCILVTEPTPFGLHDLRITVEVLRKMNIRFGVVVNRAGIGDNKVYQYCEEENIPILMEIPYQRKIAELYSKGTPFSLELTQWKYNFQTLFTQIKRLIEE